MLSSSEECTFQLSIDMYSVYSNALATYIRQGVEGGVVRENVANFIQFSLQREPRQRLPVGGVSLWMGCG